MPRLVHSLPRYRRHRGSNQGVVTLNGRDYYLGPYGAKASKVEYDRLIGEWLAGGRNPLNVTINELTVVELCVRYIRFARSYYQASDTKNRSLPSVARAIRYLRERYGRALAVEFGPLALKAIRQEMIDKGLARRTVNDSVGCIKRMFKWAVGEQLLPAAVHQALAVVPGLRHGRGEVRETERVLPVDDAPIDATLAYLPEVVADMVRLQRLTGCRPAEVCMIRPCDIDQMGDVWKYRPERHKTTYLGRNRIVFIGPQAQAILLRYLARDSQAYCFRPYDSEAKRRLAVHAARKTPISCGNVPGSNRRRRPQRKPGEKYDVDAYRRALHRACDAAFPPVGELAQREDETVEEWHGRLTDAQRIALRGWHSDHRWSPNQLRHSAATEIRRLYGLEAAATVLGHAKADVTQIYAERDYTLAARVAREVG
jgi:integrase